MFVQRYEPVFNGEKIMSDYNHFISFIKELAAKSSDVILPYFANHDVIVEQKSDETPVTIADRRAEKIMRELIGDRYPDHGVIGEEYGNENVEAEFVWVLDPIDGTKSFASACPLFGTLIALRHNGEPVLGAIHLPALKQLLIGDGKLTTLNGKPVRVRTTEKITDAIMLTTDILFVEEYRDFAGFEKLMREVKLFRTWGDCYAYFSLATGWTDIAVDPIMEEWDIQALIPILRGAGGVITAWDGSDPVHADSIVAASSALHPYVIEKINRR